MSHKQLKVKAVERPVGGACPARHRPAVLGPLTLIRCLSRPRGARVSGYSRRGPWLHPRGRRTRRPWESQPAAGHPAGPSTSLLCLAQRPSVPRTPAGRDPFSTRCFIFLDATLLPLISSPFPGLPGSPECFLGKTRACYLGPAASNASSWQGEPRGLPDTQRP